MIGFDRFAPPERRIGRCAALLRDSFEHPFDVDTTRRVDVMGQSTPVLRNGVSDLNLDCSIPDRFTTQTGATATVFARNGHDFVRISTSIKKQNGERALGSVLSRAHPGYARLMAGESYVGYATLFGTQYLTEYDTLKDARGNVIGALYVGIDVSKHQPVSVGSRLAVVIFLLVAALLTGVLWHFGSTAAGVAAERSVEILSARNIHIAFGLLAALAVAGVAYKLMHRTVTGYVSTTRTAAQQLAAGDLTTQLHVDRNDEIGRLMQAINGISQGLAEIVGNVRRASGRITEASREIAAANADLSVRTASQAASLEETAASMEELASTVGQNCANAQHANRLALSASDVAGQGSLAVAKVTEMMAAIKQQSAEIHRIVGEVEDIAFQTNILALNAAVESARAGEHGRGFTVVASEVRNLAQRSDAAAKQIKSLIRQSVAQVDTGGELVDHAVRTMGDIVTSVQRVTAIMGEIAVASREQGSGIEHVSAAIAQMDSMTQQNATLVEQASAAAESLHTLAQSLSDAVAAFKVNG